MKNLKIEKSEKLSRAVGRLLPSVSYSTLRALLRKKDVKVNGKRIADDVLLNVGDEVILYLPETMRSAYEPEVVYRDDIVMVAVKPKGIPSVGENSFEEKLQTYFNSDSLAVAHRLDTNTEGLQLVAFSEKAKEALVKAFRAGEIEKRYVTIAMGELVGNGVLRGYIVKDEDASRVTVYDKPKTGAVTAVTEYRAIGAFDGATKLEVRIKTGRTHQIRAQLAAAGHPILGDGKYGDFAFNKKYGVKSQVLKAYYLKLSVKNGLLSYLNGKTFAIDENFDVEQKLISL